MKGVDFTKTQLENADISSAKEVNRLKEKLEKEGLKGFSNNWNNLVYAINQLILKAGQDEEPAKFIWPMKGRISAPFGEKRTNSKGQVYYHTGIDIADNPEDKTPIIASCNGQVIIAGNANDGYGNKVIIDHGEGLKTLNAHCSVLKVKAGDQVKQDQQIAIVGSTGHSTGPHLHFEVIKDGKQVNPLEFLQYSLILILISISSISILSVVGLNMHEHLQKKYYMEVIEGNNKGEICHLGQETGMFLCTLDLKTGDFIPPGNYKTLLYSSL